MRTVVFGAQGQLGRDLCPVLPGEVVPLCRDDADLTDSISIHDKLAALKPSLVVNCAAYNFVDKAENDPQSAFAVNAWGTRAIAEACQSLEIRLVHFSTDYVFGLEPKRREPWMESDAPGPVSVYGLSKLAGEYLVRSNCPDHLVIRTCGLYGVWGTGGKGGNFVETMLKLAAQGKPLRVVDDQRCTPSYTADVAAATVKLIETGAQGLFHITNAGECSWYELAGEIFRLSGMNAQLTPITSEEYNAPARRPSYSVLSNEKLASCGISCRSWHDALRTYLNARSPK